MKISEIHEKVFTILSGENISTLGILNIFYFFPPKEQINLFPRIQFRFENLKSEYVGDDFEELKSVRLVLDIYDKTIPFEIQENIIKNMLEYKEGLNFSLMTGNDYHDIDEKIYGKHIIFDIQIL